MPVAASFGKTWDAVIGVFADRNIRIKTLDRASGLIVAEPESVTGGDDFADCGKNGFGGAIHPNTADWNVLVRGDSTQATVKATVRFVFVNQVGSLRKDFPCNSLGAWETTLERSVKAMAEGK